MTGREEIDSRLGTYSDDLPDDDLLEDDEIDDAIIMEVGPISGDETFRHGDKAGNNISNHASRHASDHPGRTVQRRPPRPTHSGSSNRKPTVQGGGSAHRRRTTRRVAAAEKHWGNASMPAITVRDIMGSEKKATAVGMTGSDHSHPTGNNGINDSKSGAEQKRTMIRSRWNEKRSRQSNVKNSLAQFLTSDQSGESDDGDLLEEAEDEEMISDDEELFRHGSTQSLHFDPGEDSDDARSVKSNKSQSRSHRRRRTIAKRTDHGNSADGDIPGQSNSGSRRSRRPHRKSDGVDDDDVSVGSTRSKSRSRRTSRRSSSKHGRDETIAVAHLDGEQERRSRSSEDGHTKSRSSSVRRSVPSKSRSTRKKSSADDDDRSVGSRKAVGTRRRKTAGGDDDDRSVGSRKAGAARRRNKPPVEDDDRSVGSKKSVGGRRRRQQSHRAKKSSSASREDAPTSPKPRTANLESESPPVSPLGSKPNSASSLVEATDKLASLSHHIEANPQSKTDLEERSEESSRFSASYEQPQSILQFDPTNTDNITMVRQDKANVKSEKFRHADGTESELYIAELAGLPTFEALQSKFDDSQNSDGSEPEKRPQSTRSVGSVDLASDGETPRAAKSMSQSMSHIGYSPKRASVSQKSGQKSHDGSGRTSPGNGAGRTRGVAVSRSFFDRRRKPDSAEKPPRASTQESSFQESMKGFFGGWNKKGECDSGDEEDDQPKSNRFFRKREEVEHQALDDDGSDEN